MIKALENEADTNTARIRPRKNDDQKISCLRLNDSRLSEGFAPPAALLTPFPLLLDITAENFRTKINKIARKASNYKDKFVDLYTSRTAITMKKTITLILLCLGLTGSVGLAQTLEQVTGVPQHETKAEKKAREKRLQAIADSLAFVDASNAIDINYFVITADRISLGKRGRTIQSPDESTNFIMVQGNEATIQLVPRYSSHSGFNGLGGITVEGLITGAKKETTKNGDLSYHFSVNGAAVSAQVTITVFRDSNKAEAYITPNFNSQRMTIYGPLIPYDHSTGEARAFVGNPLP